MLRKFSTLVGTLKRKIPARESGILFKDPTRLQNNVEVNDESMHRGFKNYRDHVHFTKLALTDSIQRAVLGHVEGMGIGSINSLGL